MVHNALMMLVPNLSVVLFVLLSSAAFVPALSLAQVPLNNALLPHRSF
jgi:hypothetical protein